MALEAAAMLVAMQSTQFFGEGEGDSAADKAACETLVKRTIANIRVVIIR